MILIFVFVLISLSEMQTNCYIKALSLEAAQYEDSKMLSNEIMFNLTDL